MLPPRRSAFDRLTAHQHTQHLLVCLSVGWNHPAPRPFLNRATRWPACVGGQAEERGAARAGAAASPQPDMC